MNTSRAFFDAIGAKAAEKKCFTFATSEGTRKEFKEHDWDGGGLRIPNMNVFRDLGSHINLTRCVNRATLSQRMRNATVIARSLEWMKLHVRKKR